MANIKSSKKRIKIIARNTLRNKIIKSRTRTQIKKFIYLAKNPSSDKQLIQENFTAAIKFIDMAYSKGVYHKNNAARKKSRLAKLFNKLS